MEYSFSTFLRTRVLKWLFLVSTNQIYLYTQSYIYQLSSWNTLFFFYFFFGNTCRNQLDSTVRIGMQPGRPFLMILDAWTLIPSKYGATVTTNREKVKENLFLLYFTIIYLLVNIILYMLTFIEKLYNIFNSFFYFTNKNKSRTEEMVSLSSFQR